MLGSNLTPGGQPINLSSLMTAPNGMASDILAGGAMQGLSAVGGPGLRGIAGMMGLDPMSMGLRVAQGAWGAGAGVMGAGMAGGAAMLGVGAVGAGLGFAGHQMFQGVQQQQQLNQSLSQNFRFMNPTSSTGQGFSRGQMHQIGSGIRDLTHEFGAGGEVASFGELSKLADGMGRMGMAQNVKSVKDFKEKFKQMVSTLKVVAKELGSTLEEAQQFTASMRQSGVFRAGDQIAFAKGMRTTALAGNMAQSEVTAMGSIGAQISRSVGGTGRQGMMGGMKAIGQVGTAMETGALSEEDIYNSTGLTGAEGKQAMASSMMQQSASFYKSGRGRRFLAEIAGKDGSVDMGAVSEIMGGGVPGLKHHQVGQANFIRNEGRLRGAALEQFGALGQTLAYKGWMNQRGMNIDNMDDRSMLAFQRMSGMGRDQAESALKMVQGLPEMMKSMRQTGQDQAHLDELAEHRKTSGISGMKAKLDQMKENVQGKLQQMGADLFEGGSSLIEDWFNKTTGTYERRMSADLNQVHQAVKSAVGTANKAAADKNVKTLVGTGRFLGDSGSAISRASAVPGGISDAQRKGLDRAALLDKMEFGAGAVGDKGLEGLGAGTLSGLREAYGKDQGVGSFKGDFRIAAFGRELEKMAKSDPKAAALLQQFQASADNPGAQAAIVESAEVAMGRDKGDRLSSTFKGEFGGSGARARASLINQDTRGKYSTDLEMGRTLLGTTLSGGEYQGGGAGAVRRWAHEMGNRMGIGGKEERAAAEFMNSEEGRKMVGGLLLGDEDAEKTVQDKRSKLRAIDATKRSAGDTGVLKLLDNMTVAKKLGQMMDANNGAPLSAAQKAELEGFAKSTTGRDMSYDQIVATREAGANAAASVYRDNVKEVTRKVQLEQSASKKELGAFGAVDLDASGNITGLNKDVVKAVSENVGERGMGVLNAAKEAAQVAFTGDVKEDAFHYKEYIEKQQAISNNISGMSLAEKRKFAATKGVAGTELGAMAAESAGREDRLRGREKGLTAKYGGNAKAGGTAAIASELGLDLSKDDAVAMAGVGSADAANAILKKAGIDPSKAGDYQKALIESLEASKKGDKGRAADILADAKANAPPEVKEKLKEAADAKRGDTPDANLSRIAENTKATVDNLKLVTNAINTIKLDKNPEEPKDKK